MEDNLITTADGLSRLLILWGEFEERFKPELFEGEESLMPRDWPLDCLILDKALEEGRCWTLVSGDDGVPFIVSGLYCDHRLHQVITEISYGDEHWISYMSGYSE